MRLDGHRVQDLSLSSLRRNVGLAFEDAFLYSGTIHENVAYGRPDAPDDDTESALETAQAAEFVAQLPEKAEAVVGEGGVTLSGGQRQRIALARVLLTDPAVLVLDDATSAVDARVEHEIHEGLRTHLEGRTALLIAHRRSTLALADRILLLEGGRITESGSHEQLHARSAHYRALLSGFEEPDEPAHGIVHRRAGETTADGAPPVPAEPRVVPQARPDSGVRRPGGGPGSHGRPGPGTGWIGTSSPELLQSVEELPPIRDTSKVALADQVHDLAGLHFRRFIRAWRPELAVGLGLVVLDALATLAVPLLVRRGIDQGVAFGALSVVLLVSVAAFGVALFDAWAMWSENLVTGRAAERILVALRLRVFAHLQRLGLDFFDRELSGRLLSRLTSDVDTITELLSSGLVNAAVALVTFVGMVVVLLVLDVPLALAVFAVTLPLAVATVLYQRLARVRPTTASATRSGTSSPTCRRTSQGCGSPRRWSGRSRTAVTSTSSTPSSGARDSPRSGSRSATSPSSSCSGRSGSSSSSGTARSSTTTPGSWSARSSRSCCT